MEYIAVMRPQTGDDPVPLPTRWTRRQRLKNTIIFHLLRALAALWRGLPRWSLSPCATVLGTIAHAVAGRERRRAVRQLAQALPDTDPRERRRMARRMFIHLAHSALEMAHLPALLKETPLSPAQRRLLDDAFAEGKGVVAVGGHIGNWELLAQVLAGAYPVHTIAKPLYDPRLTQWIERERSAHGLRVIWRGEPRAARAMLRVFRHNQMLALLIDQDTQVDGAFVPFFGRPAHTPTAAASLALRTGAPIIVGWTHRDAHGRHAVHLERFDNGPSALTTDTVTDLTVRLSARLEHAIRMQPAQWVWLHARWQRQPLES